MFQFAKSKGPAGLSILEGTEAWNLFKMLYSWNINTGWSAITKGISKMKKAELEGYYDKLLSIDIMKNSTATEMEKFIKKEIHDLKKLAKESGLDIEDLMKVDWEQWVGLYEIPSEYLNEARWLSPAEKISTLVGILKEQENVSPRQREEEYASDNIFSIADWEYVANHAKIVSGGLY